MPWLLSVDAVAFTILGYPLSYIELVGTVLYLLSVWLIARRNILTWPVGIASVILYGLLFYQIRLYADTFEQGYYLIISIYGWWRWGRAEEKSGDSLPVAYSTPREALLAGLVTVVLSLAAWRVVASLHRWLPSAFPEEASYPFLDALTTIMSFTAMWLMARQRVESWWYWIVVDAIGIWLYYVKGTRFVALLYVILLGMAINGLVRWRRR
jgi:nicotinamide mononucleotide transporter